MFEMCGLLRWAAQRLSQQLRHDVRPGRVTFIAALAEWKADPEATFEAELDQLPLSSVTELVARVCGGADSAKRELARLLRDKLDRTSIRNVDTAGLVRVQALL